MHTINNTSSHVSNDSGRLVVGPTVGVGACVSSCFGVFKLLANENLSVISQYAMGGFIGSQVGIVACLCTAGIVDYMLNKNANSDQNRVPPNSEQIMQ